MLGGVTATPWRGDAYDIDQVLGPPLFQMGIGEGLGKGFLSEVDYRILADNLNWEFVQEASKFKYSLSQLNRKLIIPIRDEIAVRQIKDVFEKTKRKAGLVFSPTIVHSHSFAASLRKYNFEAEVISSDTDPRDREQIMSRFRTGKIHFVVTVDLFNEGVDVPDVDMIVFMRSTHSRRIFVQQLGRGLRPSPLKDKVVVLDFVTDLRRVAEVVELDKSVRSVSVEQLNLGGHLIEFADRTAGTFLTEWMLDQADLMLREGDPTLQLPKLNFPEPPSPGAIQ
jgi:superfamily II DNA or RNA helicase